MVEVRIKLAVTSARAMSSSWWSARSYYAAHEIPPLDPAAKPAADAISAAALEEAAELVHVIGKVAHRRVGAEEGLAGLLPDREGGGGRALWSVGVRALGVSGGGAGGSRDRQRRGLCGWAGTRRCPC